MDHYNQILPKFWIAVLFYVMAGLGPALWGPTTGWAQNPGAGQNSPRPEVAYATRSDTTIPLRHMPQIPPMPAVLGEIFERPRKLLPNREGTAAPTPGVIDPVLQGPTAQVGAPTSGANFEGINNVNSVLPPDPSGAIGPNHYVQMVNLAYKIWDRNGNTLMGPSNINTLWQGFGGPCQSTNDGDPVVLYDHLADRWFMSQFALPRFPRGPFYQCIAVSQSPDPTGSWHRYEFTMSQTKLNDYPKFGVWPDGYYMAINQFSCSIFGCSWGGQGAVAFERDAMLNGAPARMVYFDLYSVNANLGGMLPSDLDGPPPPLGAPNYFVEVDDSTWGFPRDQLQIWEFHVDWSNPANLSTFNHNLDLATAGFNPDLCGYARNCIPQGNSAYKVDAISDRLMYRLQYRNFGDYQTLVTNHTVDVNGADRAGIRWYELRNSGGGWSIRQQGTYSPGTDHRWMGSIAMNGQGDIALGYSRTNASPLYPSVYATGRLASDDATTPLGQLPQPELMIVNGSGYQTHSAARWGDYSQMTVDPLDDCTFWYTQEYYQTTGSAPWQTRIASIQLGDCGPGTPPAAPTLLTATPGDGEVSLSWTGSAGADTYNVKRGTASGGPYAAVSTGVATTSYTDTTVTNGTTYYYVVTAVNSVDESANSNETSATPAAPIAPEGPTHLTATPGDGQVSLSWTGSVGADTYNVKRSTISGGSYSSVSTGVATTSYTDTTVTNGTTYYYVVTAVNSVDESANSNEASATPAASPVPATPSNLVATGGPGKKQIKLSWNAAQGATSHNIYRGTASGGPYVLTATGVSSTNYTNTGLSSGTTYYYVVTGVNSSGEGPASNEATATAR